MKESTDNQGLTVQAYFLLGIVIFGWGISWPFLKIALAEIPPFTFRGLIAPTAALVIFGVGFLLKFKISYPKGQWREITLAAFLNITVWHLFSAFGIRLLGGGHASIIAYTMPLWAVILSILFIGEKSTRARIIGLVLGMSGLAVLLSGEFGILRSAPVGVFFMLASAIGWGAGTVVQKSFKWRISTLSLVGWQLVIGGLPITIIALFIETPNWLSISSMAVGSTIFILLIPIILCWFVWFRVIEMLPVSICTLSTLLVPIIGVISSNIILGEEVGWREFVSLLLICTALALVLKPTGGKSQGSNYNSE
jgi:drug/metabolite transporter (DMT)-like permease